MAQRRLMPMDIVLYDKQLWVVTTAHIVDNQGRQKVNLAGYERKEYIDGVESYKCRIVEDENDRKQIEVMPGMVFYPEPK